MTSTVAGCWSPKILDGGFQCDPANPSPCPEGYFCREFTGSYLCTTGYGMPSDDLAGGGGGGGGGGVGGGGGGGDVDMAGPEDMTVLPPDMVMLPTNCTPSNLVINEVQTGPGYSEFIEIWNPCGNTITVTGKLVYRFDTASADTNTLATMSNRAIAAQGYLVIANTVFSSTADFTYTNIGMADGGGGVALKDNGSTVYASMGWGTAKNSFQHGTAAPTEGTGKSIARKPNGASSGSDSNDFKSSTPTPGAAN